MRKFLVTEEQLRKHNVLAFDEGGYPCLHTTYWDGFTPIQEVLVGDNLTEREINFIKWIYDRLINVHGENENYDYMQKLKTLIEKVKPVL